MYIAISNSIGASSRAGGSSVNEAFEFTVQTDNAGTSADNQFTIPITSSTPYNIKTSDGQSITGATGATTLTFPSPGTYTVKITESCVGWRFKYAGDRLKMLNISNWGVFHMTQTEAFHGAQNMTCTAIDPPLFAPTKFYYAFRYCTRFNGAIGNWDMSNVTNMQGAFYGANDFNQDLTDWDTSNVTTMREMFYFSSFNGDVSNWDVTNLSSGLAAYRLFGRSQFNRDLSNWDVSNWTSMAYMFEYCPFNNNSIANWNVSNVTNMSGLFNQNTQFNQDISGWDTSSVTNMAEMFRTASSFNQNIGAWDTSSVTNMQNMFYFAGSFNNGGDPSINNWNTSNVTNMINTFGYASAFNQPIGNWDVSSVTGNGLQSMFNHATVFNQDLSTWNVTSNVTSFSSMFNNARAFNQDISGWDASGVTNMASMFIQAYDFNQDISSWDTSNVTNFTTMFRFALDFNQPIGSWNTSSATNMTSMLENTQLDQDLSNWNITQVTSFGNFKSLGATLSTANYDALLVAWESQLQTAYPGGTGYTPVISISFGNAQYTLGSAAETARTSLINTFGWTVTDGGGITAPFEFTVKTDNAGTSNPDQFTIPITSATPYDITTSDGQSITGATGTTTLTFPAPGTYTVTIRNSCEGWRFNNGGDRRKLLNINSWGPFKSTVTGAFYGASNMTCSATDAPLYGHTQLGSCFRNCFNFNGAIGNWDVSNVTGLDFTFNGATNFNQPIGSWNTSSVTNMVQMFYSTSFNQDISGWDVSSVTNMAQMFGYNYVFNQDISGWNVSNVRNIQGMFNRAYAFAADLSSWNINGITTLNQTFSNARAFNSDISGWDTSLVTSLRYAFSQALVFNQDISGWDTSSVTDMFQTFRYARSFNQPIGAWNTSSVVTMDSMFENTPFDQDLSNWNIVNVTAFNYFKRMDVPFSTANYDAILVSWEAQLQAAYPGGVGYTPTISIDFNASQYTLGSAAETARTSLINTFGWTITDGGGIVERNTRIGGMASVYTTPASVASALGSGVTESDITNFRISGSDVEFDVGVTYTLPDTFKNNTTITAFDDRQGNVIGLANQAFRYCSAINYLNFPSLTVLPSFTFEGLTNLVSADFISCTDVGGGNNFLANITATITVALSALTSDADGGPHQSLRTLNCTVDYDGYVDDGTWNTQIDGIAATENTRLLLGNRLGCKTAALLNFQIVGNDVRAKVYGNYSINGSAFQSRTDITDFKDNDNKVTNINPNAFAYTTNYLNATFNGITSLVANNQFRNSAIDTITMNALTTISGNYLARDTAVLEFIFPNLINWNTNALLYGNSSLNNIYAPKLETLGLTTGYDGAIANNFANGGTITVSDVLQTCNGGLPDGDLDYIITNRNANVIYVTPLLLDQYSGASAAYSLRDLSSSFVGNPVVNVRRSSDNATQDFTSTEITDGTLLAFVGAGNDGFVVTWYDQSGNNKHATTASSSNQPRIVLGGSLNLLNGEPSILSSPSQYFTITPAALSSTTEVSIIGVAELSSSNGQLYSYRDSSNDLLQVGKRSGVYKFQIRSSSTALVELNNGFVGNQILHFAKINRTTNSHLYALNSTNIVTDTTVISGTISSTEENINAYNSGPLTTYHGVFQEIIVYPSDQSTNRTGIETNINNHYSIYGAYENNLVASYNFDADFTDYTGNHPLTPSGTTPPVASVSGGVVSNCAQFNSTGDYTLTADSDDFSFTNGVNDLPFSVSFWANFDSYSSSSAEGAWFLSKRDGSINEEYQIMVYQDELALTLFNNGGNSSFLNARVAYIPPIGSWHHYTVTYDGSATFAGIKIYIDGVSQTIIDNSVGTYTGMVNKTKDINIGSRSWQPSAGSFWGKLDEFHIWKNRELTSAEVLDIYNTENAGNSIL